MMKRRNMDLRIQNQSQPEIDSPANVPANLKAQPGNASSASHASAPGAAQDTACISAATSQLSGDVSVRQDRVDALRLQVEAGTYTIAPHAVANAMFQNLFRS
jgi:flagellar biosynthesis anti-sigma factor FlgM